MDFIITHPNGTTLKLNSYEQTSIVESAKQSNAILGVDTVTINVKSATPLELYIGDTINVFGTTYTVNELPTAKRASGLYEYTIKCEGLQYGFIDRVFLMPDNTQGNNLMLDLKGIADILIDNVNRNNTGKQFVLGNYPTPTEAKNLSYNDKNCLQVLQNICKEWDTEFQFVEDEDEITLHLQTIGDVYPYSFKYGQTGGLYNIQRAKGKSDVITRLFVYGGTQNLTYYRHNRLCLPNADKNASYIEDAAAQAVYGIKEGVKNFDDIYPNRIGSVTALGADYKQFVDSSMDFDLNEKWGANDYAEWLALRNLPDTTANRNIFDNDVAGKATKWLIAGQTATIHFNSGNLAGYEIEIVSYDADTKTFKLKPLIDENNYEFPSRESAAFQIGVGDEYVILNINLPLSYKTQAEIKLATEAADYFDTVKAPLAQYTLEIDEFALKRIAGDNAGDTQIFKIGDYIHVVDADAGVDDDIRIQSLERDLCNVYHYKLTLSNDAVKVNAQTRVLIDVDNIKRVIFENHLSDPNRQRRAYRDATELYDMVFDTDGYFQDKIAPLSIDTTMLKVGARSQQFTLQGITFQANYNADPTRLESSAGQLVHYTINDDDTIRTWNIAAGSFSNLATTGLYIYARCNRNDANGIIVITATQYRFDADSSYYYFLCGNLLSVDVVTQTRPIAMTYGFTTVNGRYIKTGRIQSSDGQTYFDLDSGTICGNIRFEANKTASETINGLIDDTVSELSGINLCEGSIGDDIKPFLVWSGVKTTPRQTHNGHAAVRLTANSDATAWLSSSEKVSTSKISAGDTITISAQFWANNTQTNKHRFCLRFANAELSQTNLYTLGDYFTPTYGEWGHVTFTGTVPNDIVFDTITIFVTAESDGLWINVTEIMVERGSVATEWSIAPEDVQKGISDAKTAANSAISTINNMNGDTIFSMIEKKSFKPEWVAINGVVDTTSGSATSTGSYLKAVSAVSGTSVSTSTLATTYEALRAYLADKKLNVAEDTSGFSQATLGQKVRDYYNAETKVYDDLAEYYTTLIEVGGTNLLRGSVGNDIAPFTVNGDGTIYTPQQKHEGQETVRFTATSANTVFFQSTQKVDISKLPNGAKVVISAWVYANHANENKHRFILRFGKTGGSDNLANIGGYFTPTYGEWSRIVFTGQVPTNIDADYITTFFTIENGNGLWVSVTQLKVEVGTIPTAWSLAPEDVTQEMIDEANAVRREQSYLNAAYKSNTDIKGGLILSSLIQVRNPNSESDEDVKAGMNGVVSDGAEDVRFWAGGTLAKAAQTLASTNGTLTENNSVPFVVLHDGTVILSKAIIDAIGAANKLRFENGKIVFYNGTTKKTELVADTKASVDAMLEDMQSSKDSNKTLTFSARSATNFSQVSQTNATAASTNAPSYTLSQSASYNSNSGTAFTAVGDELATIASAATLAITINASDIQFVPNVSGQNASATIIKVVNRATLYLNGNNNTSFVVGTATVETTALTAQTVNISLTSGTVVGNLTKGVTYTPQLIISRSVTAKFTTTNVSVAQGTINLTGSHQYSQLAPVLTFTAAGYVNKMYGNGLAMAGYSDLFFAFNSSVYERCLHIKSGVGELAYRKNFGLVHREKASGSWSLVSPIFMVLDVTTTNGGNGSVTELVNNRNYSFGQTAKYVSSSYSNTKGIWRITLHNTYIEQYMCLPTAFGAAFYCSVLNQGYNSTDGTYVDIRCTVDHDNYSQHPSGVPFRFRMVLIDIDSWTSNLPS